MANKITANITFYFKGETFTPTLELNLDELMQRYNGFPPLYEMLAAENNIDSYSYHYEMMLAEDIQFSNAEGYASQFLNGSEFDQTGFEHFWKDHHILANLQPIIKQELNIDDIEQHPNLKRVLLAAYHSGKKTRTTELDG